mmetsp:Transcript_38556/g.83038  ORF Transcript_38556/g.83038 Transcript_38556/m.83038 type:complete len:80 (+) Transcript_38556:407-646(+)
MTHSANDKFLQLGCRRKVTQVGATKLKLMMLFQIEKKNVRKAKRPHFSAGDSPPTLPNAMPSMKMLMAGGQAQKATLPR